jgi:DMSO/TMAO reductase YedYZ molybdopterin-dependent catalytic subunit
MSTETSTTSQPGSRPRLVRRVLLGALAGLVAGLVLVVVQLAARLLLGVAPPPELAGEFVAPRLTIAQFFDLLRTFGGYDELKAFGVGSGLFGEVAFATALGGVAGALSPRRVPVVLLGAGGFFATATVVLWPVLWSNFRGLPPTAGRVVTVVVTALGIGVFAGVLLALLRWLLPGAAASGAAEPARSDPDAPRVGRRALLGGGAAAGLAAASGGLGTVLVARSTFGYDGLAYRPEMPQPITPNDEFYVVTKNVVDPAVVPRLWQLTVAGDAVARPFSLDLAGLRALPPAQREVTLMCISNAIGSGLVSNAVWTGVPLRDLLDQAGVADDAVEVVGTSVDGYVDTFPIGKALEDDTLVAYEMNGVPLPRRHGYPVRLIVPGLFGEKSVKWLTRLEVVREPVQGFYERQGWGPTFSIPIRSQFSSPPSQVRAGTLVPLAGFAFAGGREIAQVDVSTDGGTSWQPAEFTYAKGGTVWDLWRYDWRPQRPGRHQLVVRARTADGDLQTTQRRGIAPQGARGRHHVEVQVLA